MDESRAATFLRRYPEGEAFDFITCATGGLHQRMPPRCALARDTGNGDRDHAAGPAGQHLLHAGLTRRPAVLDSSTSMVIVFGLQQVLVKSAEAMVGR